MGFILLVCLLPLTAAGQEVSVQSLIEQGQQAGANAELMRSVASRAEKGDLSTEQTAKLLRPAVTLAERGLPSAPLLNKTLEGLAKRVPPSRMAPVIQQVQTHTEQAGTVVSGWLERGDVKQLVGASNEPSAATRDQLITSVTEAQQQNIPAETVEQFLNSLPDALEQRSVSLSQVSTAVRVMPDLPGSKTDPAAAQQVLTAALNAGYDGESMRQLPGALESAQRQTQRPAASVAQGAARAIAQGTPASSVLRSLFQGSIPGGGPPSGIGEGPPSSLPGQEAPSRRQGKGPGENPGNGNPGNGNQGGGNQGGG